MNVWQFLDGIIRHPPFVLIAIVIAILAAHALKIALEFITKRRQRNSLIITLEIMVVIVLGYLAIHLHVEKLVGGIDSTSPQNEAFWMACLLVFFSIVSMIVYLIFRAILQEHKQD